MASGKRSARQRQRAEFEGSLGGLDEVFSRAEREREERREERWRKRGCERKRNYGSRLEAEDAIAACAARGQRGLRCYRCDFCGGWHLTSH